MASVQSPQTRLYWILCIAAFFAAVAVIFFQNELFYRDFLSYMPRAPSPALSERHTVRLTIDFGNGTKRAFVGQGSGLTITAALRLAAASGSFAVETSPNGVITTIAAVRNDTRHQWQTYQNSTLLSDLPGRIELRPGDRILFRYE